ncbi:MAG TPA: UbiD family decarboxylase [Phycisphaerales bacterium]|nr:UbiD family decarboxylase [Phycisphaerales bacterium]HMP36330.1 UbiD family decarboxylase [Phycisphaerales bacterium]
MYPTLRALLARLERDGELCRISAEVSPILEIAEIIDRQCKSPCARPSRWARAFDPGHADCGGSALLFERVAGCDFPVAANVFGSYRRMEIALGVEERGGLEAIAARIASLTRPQPPRSLGELLARARELLPLLLIPPRSVRRGRCQEVVRLTSRGEVDLARLPILKCWPLDGDPSAVGCRLSPAEAGTAAGSGRYITFAGMHTIHADDREAARPASHNIGMYRAQLVNRTQLAMHWHMHHDGAAHWRSWKRLGRPMPIAICLGGSSVMAYGATAPLPPGISELLMCGFLAGRGVPMVRAATVPLRVPADSEIVIEGWVSTEAGGIGWDHASGEPLGPGAVYEGPFGDHTGFYSLPDRYPVVDVTAITHARDAICPTTIVGLPPQEDYYLGKATERVFLPLLRTVVHDIEDYHLPRFGCFHNAAFVRIRKAYPLQARRVMHSIWGAGQMAWTKTIVVVDDDVLVHDERAVWRAVLERCDFRRDVEIVNGPLDILDHAAPRLGAGCKIGFDATRRIPGEEVDGVAVDRRPEAPPPSAIPPQNVVGCAFGFPFAVAGDATQCEPWSRRLVALAVEKRLAGDGLRAIEAFWRAAPPGIGDLAIAVDASVDLSDPEAILFHWVSNSDAGRDLLRDTAPGAHRLGIDATSKSRAESRNGQPCRDWPPLLAMDDATRSLVDRRWGEYGLRPSDSRPLQNGSA